MADLSVLVEKLRIFRDEREWKQFHNHKDLAISLVLEAAELLEHFQWKSLEEGETYARDNREEILDEIADVLKYLVQLADNLGAEDIVEVAIRKLEKDAVKYPIEKSKGKSTKYTHL